MRWRESTHSSAGGRVSHIELSMHVAVLHDRLTHGSLKISGQSVQRKRGQ